MSEKFVVNGGLSIPSGKKLELQGTEVDASAAELNVLNTFSLAGINTDNDMASASTTTMASDASVKAYVDAQLGASVLTFTTDTEGNNNVDLDDDTLTLSGGDGVSVTHDGDEITFATEFASTGDTNTGTSTTTSVTPAGLTAWTGDTAVVTLGTIGTGTWQGTAIATTYIADDAVTPAKMSIFDDTLAATNTHFMIADGTDYSSFAMSGDVTCTNGGVVTIAANAVQTGMVHDDVATELGGTGLTASSGVLAVDASQSQITTLAGATDIGATGVDTAFAGEVTIDETLTVTGVATIAKGSLLASSDAPTTDAMIANKKYVDDQVTGSDLDLIIGSTSYDLDLTTEELKFAGTANEIDVAFAESNAGNADNVGTLTIGLPDSVTIGDALSVTGATDMSSTLTVGVDGTGYDVKFFGDTASAYMLWDQSADDLVLAGAAGIDLAGDIDVDGTANLDEVDIDGAVQIDGATTFGVNDTGVDVKFFGATDGAYMLWDESADDLVLAGAAGIDLAGDIDVDGTANLDAVDIDGNTQADGTITVGADTDGYDVKFFGDTASAYMLWDESADNLALAGTATLSVAGLTTLTGGATIPTGKDLTIIDAPGADTDAANKAYVDGKMTASDLDFTTDGDEVLQIALETEELDIAGGSNITTSGAANTVTVALDSAVSGLTSVSATTVTDTVASMNAGSLSGVVNIAASGTLGVTGIGTFTAQSVHNGGIDCNGALDASGASSFAATGVLTNIRGTLSVDEAATLDTTLGVTGIATFTAQSVHNGGIDCNGALDASGASSLAATGVLTNIRGTLSVDEAATFDVESIHSGGIDCNGDLDMGGNDITGSSDDMLIQSGTIGTDYSWSSGKNMALQSENEIVLDSAVRLKSDFAQTADASDQTMFEFDGEAFFSAKIHVRISDGADTTAKEILVVCDADGANPAFVEYGTVSSGSSDMTNTWAVAASSGTITVSCTGATGDTIKGSYELLKD